MDCSSLNIWRWTYIFLKKLIAEKCLIRLDFFMAYWRNFGLFISLQFCLKNISILRSKRKGPADQTLKAPLQKKNLNLIYTPGSSGLGPSTHHHVCVWPSRPHRRKAGQPKAGRWGKEWRRAQWNIVPSREDAEMLFHHMSVWLWAIRSKCDAV